MSKPHNRQPLHSVCNDASVIVADVQLPEIAEPPSPPESLGEHEVSRVVEPTVEDVTFTINAVFIPQRVGAPDGVTELRLVGRTLDAPLHPGQDYQSTQLYERMAMDRIRLGRYRWRLIEVMLEPPFAKLAIDRTAMAAALEAPRLDDGDAVTFWLSTHGVTNLELRTRASWYGDYVQVELHAHAGHDGTPWKVTLMARRCFEGCETVRWERPLVLGQPAAEQVALGDHQLELIEVAWLGESPAELHARFRLARGVTKQGLEPTKPPPPWRPHVR